MSAGTPICLAELLDPECILIDPPAQDRAAVIKDMVRGLVTAGRIAQSQSSTVTRLINEREALGSTALGSGVALPHARVKFAKGVIFAYARLREGRDFKPLDGRPVRHVFMALTPKDDDGLHVTFLKAMTLFIRNPIHLKALDGCKKPEDVCAVLRDYA